jgi:regulatory protein
MTAGDPGGGARRPGTGRGRPGGLRRRVPASPDDPASLDGARAQAIRLLARRDYAKRELAGRLTERGFAAEAAAGAVAMLEDERLVNDGRYVEAAVASRIARGQGPRRIALELRRLGLDGPLVEQAVDAGAPDWARRALDLKERRFGRAAPADRHERARQARFLLYRGYTLEHVRAALGGRAADLDDVDLDDPEPRDEA